MADTTMNLNQIKRQREAMLRHGKTSMKWVAWCLEWADRFDEFYAVAKAMNAAQAKVEPVTVPDDMALVPVEPTPEIIAAAAIAVWPTASSADIELARKAAPIVLMGSDLGPGHTVETLAAALATMAPAYRAMIAAAPKEPSNG